MRILQRTAIIGLAAVILVGCASTRKRYEKGVELQEQGRYVEACNYFIRVLQKEPEWENARERLSEAGASAIDQYMAQADANLARNDHVAAYDVYGSIEGLILRARSVRVTLAPPPDLESRRQESERNALEQLVYGAESAAASGRWAQAINMYGRARAWNGIDAQRIREIDGAVARVHLDWAIEEYEEGHFRSSFEQAAATISVVGPDHAMAQEAMELQHRAVEEGSIVVAFLPLGRTEGVIRSTEQLFVDDLNDVLLYDHWTAPHTFIIAADPIVVRRELRRIAGRGARVVSRGDAIELGRAIDVDFVVVGEITEYEEAERGIKEKTHEARTRGRNAQDTTFTVRTFTLQRDAKVSYRIYNVRNRATVDQGRAEANASQLVERGVYTGDYRDLDLSGRELAYFDPDELAIQDEAIDTQLADHLAVRMAEQVIARLNRLIP